MPVKNKSAATDKTDFDHKAFLALLTHQPGVYQMFDAAGVLLYVGKAKSLKKRLGSYFQANLAPKTHSLVSKIARIEVTLTETETEALLLEQNLIKQHYPSYNILLRDDKSYPYVYIASEDEYPRIDFHRGPKRAKGRYFGPYPDSGAVRESLQFLQKTFRLRPCADSFFKNRSRPCLQYQIQRCTAPCVRAITPERYAEDVRHAVMFLDGKEDAIIPELANAMEDASEKQHYEEAAHYRDQISHLRQMREPQAMEEGEQDADIMALCLQQGVACVQVITVRHGRVLGSRSYFPQFKMENEASEILSAFMAQYYLGNQERMIPPVIILDRSLNDPSTSESTDESEVLLSALTQASNRKVTLLHKVRTHRAKWQQLAVRTAEQNLLTRLNSRQSQLQRMQRLQEVLMLDAIPEHLECFDISHSSGGGGGFLCGIRFTGSGQISLPPF